MKHLGRLLALAGLLLAIALFVREDARAIFGLVVSSSAGLMLAALFHVVPMVLNARAWQVLLPGGHRARSRRPTLATMAWAVWIRESVNGLLPVARIGGEMASYRLLRFEGMRGAWAAAGLVVDMALSMLTQLAFALLGVGLLFAVSGPSPLVRQLAAGVLIMVVLGAAFMMVQRAGAFESVTRVLNKLAAGRLAGAIESSVRIDRAIRAMYGRRRAVMGSLAWQWAAWVAGAGEVWLALYFLDHPVSIASSVAIEALIQAVSSAAFLVPAAIGIQEGAFLVIGAAFGIDATTSLALASARRLRDVVIFFPGLIAWQWVEARAGSTGRLAKQSR